MTLLFQSQRQLGGSGPRHGGGASPGERARVLKTAITAQLLGNLDQYVDLFTVDVECTTPHTSLRSLEALVAACASSEDVLSDAHLEVRLLDDVDDAVCAEWRLDAAFTGPLLLQDDVLVEPTGQRVHLRGATVAEFRGHRICSIRHYFDDSELLDQIRPGSRYQRWLVEVGQDTPASCDPQ